LKDEVVVKRGGDSKEIIHYIWQGITRFILLSKSTIDALCAGDFSSKKLQYSKKTFFYILKANLIEIKKKAAGTRQIELFGLSDK